MVYWMSNRKVWTFLYSNNDELWFSHSLMFSVWQEILQKCLMYEAKFLGILFFWGSDEAGSGFSVYFLLAQKFASCATSQLKNFRDLRLRRTMPKSKTWATPQKPWLKICRLPGHSPDNIPLPGPQPPNTHCYPWTSFGLALKYLWCKKAAAVGCARGTSSSWADEWSAWLAWAWKRIAAGVKNTQTKSICPSRRCWTSMESGRPHWVEGLPEEYVGVCCSLRGAFDVQQADKSARSNSITSAKCPCARWS